LELPRTEQRLVTIALAIGLALLLGAGLSVQAGINTSLRVSLGHPLHAVIVSFVFGLGFIAIVALVTGARLPTVAAVARAPIWTYLGGVIGGLYVLGVIILAPRLGAATLMALIVTGQLVAALVIDQLGWVGFERRPLGIVRLVGVVLLILGAVLVRR
jgi:transporter family-2 protein